MKTSLIHLPTAKEPWFDLAVQAYLEKINHFHKFELKAIKPSIGTRDSETKRLTTEAIKISEHLKPDQYIIVFDLAGKPLSSEVWAKQLEKILNSGKKGICLVVGGPYGLDQSIKERADLSVSLGPIIMNHLVAEVVILEQWYRAWTILKNMPYHNSNR